MNITIRCIVGLLFLSLLSACNPGDEIEAAKEIQDGKKIWIFAQVNVPKEGNTIEDYYYFAQVNESLYKKIKGHRIKQGFIVFQNVRYWTNDDTIKSIGDEIYDDEMLFRIEDIRKIDLVKNEPKIGFRYGEQQEAAETEKAAPVKIQKTTSK